ncbi:hypothetical protein BH11PSE11_BH11PSE11_10650 [soil metagenome]
MLALPGSHNYKMSRPRIPPFFGQALVVLALLSSWAQGAEESAESSAIMDSLTADTSPVNAAGIIFPLKSSDTISLSGTQTDPKKLDEIRAEQILFAAYLREQDGLLKPVGPAKPPADAVASPVNALQAEADRIKLQTQSDKAALNAVAVEASTLRGFLVFGAILLACLLVVGWALWHSHVVRKNELEDSWERTRDDDLGVTDFMLLEGSTEFANTQFGNTEFSNSEIPRAELHRSEFQTTAAYHADDADPAHDSLPVPGAPAWTPAAALPVEPAQPAPAKQQERPFIYRRVSGDDGAWAFKFTAKDRAAKAGQADANEKPTEKPVDPARLRKAHEIYNVMQLAESWMSVHDPVDVLETLEPFKDVELPESPIPWLCLLDVYRVLGDQKKYDAILKRIKKIFNVKMPPLDAPALNPKERPQVRRLADYPNIVERIFDLWETDEIVPYLEGLLVDNRDGTRDGFDLPVYRNILQLIALASDPDPSKRHDQITHGKAYAILYSEMPREPAGILRFSETAGQRDTQVRHMAVEEIKFPLEPKSEIDEYDDQSQLQTPAAPAGHGAASLVDDQEPAIDYDDLSSMSIKLHLAIAYIDIGDEEGARLLLDEVIKDGTVEQSEKAKLMLARLPENT